jgi:dTDP-glucose 4,6-dehydratase
MVASEAELRERYPECPASRNAKCAELVSFVPDRPGHDWRYAINADKLRAATGFAPRHKLPEGLGNTVRWYLDNEDWWRPLLDARYTSWLRQNYREAGRK